MFDKLAEGFRKATESFRGQATLTEDNVSSALKDIRSSLLEADVEYGVVKHFLARVKEGALGEIVSLKAGKGTAQQKVTPGDHFVKICKDELEALMGPVDTNLNLPHPAIVMMVGLQGTGKTTTTGKLAKYLKERKRRKPLLVAADIYRPAAVHQLKVLGERIGVPVFHKEGASPVEICREALGYGMLHGCDTILFDTAGRLTVDDALMNELEEIKRTTHPHNILLVCDAMMGQDAVTTAKAFHDRLDLTGFIMTKLDGDARGGAALSIKEVTGRPIKFLGMGEELDRLEEFRPEGLASRILGMGDIVGLMDDFERVAEGDMEDQAMKMLQGQFNFRDFYQQIAMIQKMGSLKDIMAKLPGQSMLPKDANLDDRELIKIKAMIDSMTEKERINPDLLTHSRIQRISRGSGRSQKEVQELIKKFKTMRTMMSSMGKLFGGGGAGLLDKIPGLGNMARGMSQMNQMRKMAQNLQNMDLGGLGAHPGAGPGFSFQRTDKDKLKKARKAAKNRKK